MGEGNTALGHRSLMFPPVMRHAITNDTQDDELGLQGKDGGSFVIRHDGGLNGMEVRRGR